MAQNIDALKRVSNARIRHPDLERMTAGGALFWKQPNPTRSSVVLAAVMYDHRNEYRTHRDVYYENNSLFRYFDYNARYLDHSLRD
jgi:hypothetical protein